MVNAVPEMGFRTSGTGTSTGNGTAISGTGKLRVSALTPIQNQKLINLRHSTEQSHHT
jgi:hypothetical protein